MIEPLEYARTRLAALGYKEWDDAFNFTNIPKTILDRRFHLEFNSSRGTGIHQNNQDIDVPFTVRLFKSPARNTIERRDSALERAWEVISDFIQVSNRTGGERLKNVRFENLFIEPLNETNDNGLIMRIEFVGQLVMPTA